MDGARLVLSLTLVPALTAVLLLVRLGPASGPAAVPGERRPAPKARLERAGPTLLGSPVPRAARAGADPVERAAGDEGGSEGEAPPGPGAGVQGPAVVTEPPLPARLVGTLEGAEDPSEFTVAWVPRVFPPPEPYRCGRAAAWSRERSGPPTTAARVAADGSFSLEVPAEAFGDLWAWSQGGAPRHAVRRGFFRRGAVSLHVREGAAEDVGLTGRDALR